MSHSRILTLSSTPSCSRCFRTDAEGRIPLRRDWPELFAGLAGAESYALQSRHTYARLIHLGPLPTLTWDDAQRSAHDDAGTLFFRADRWGHAWGHLELCECCDSPGYIEIQNLRGGDILQICPNEETWPTAWANRLATLVEPRPLSSPEGALAGFPLIPDEARALQETSSVLPTLLHALGRLEVSVQFTLRTPEVAHRREFIPLRVSSNYPVMTVTDFRSTLQLALPPVQGITVGPDLALHLAGPSGTLLLSLAPAAEHRAAWTELLPTFLPSIAPYANEAC